jgi:hypothetical protein
MISKPMNKKKGRNSKKHGRNARVATKKGLIKRSRKTVNELPKAERVDRKSK